jgi:hypothetical protein
MGKQIIRLTESDLHQMVKEAVNKILKEGKFVNNKRLSFTDPLYDKKGWGKGQQRFKNNFSQRDEVELAPHSEMNGYDIKFRKDLLRLKKMLRERYGVNPNSLHTRIVGTEFSNPHDDVSIMIPRNEAQKIRDKEGFRLTNFWELAKQFHFGYAPSTNSGEQRELFGTLCLMYDNPDNDDFEDGYSEHGIRVSHDGKAYQPIENEPEGSDAEFNEFSLDDEYPYDEDNIIGRYVSPYRKMGRMDTAI